MIAPYAFFCAGIIGGALLLILAAAVQGLSVYMLLVSAHLSGRASYRGLADSLFGRFLPRMADLVCFLYAFAVVTLHLIVLRDLLPFILSHWAQHEVSQFIALPIFSVVVLLPVFFFARKMTVMVFPSLAAFIW